MNLYILLIPLLGMALFNPSQARADGKHLFILSGQSNMQGLNPDTSFTPVVEKEYGKENIIVVHDALGGQPILKWYKQWKPAEGEGPKADGALYDRLMVKLNEAIKDQEISTVSFVWMQGERDAKMKWGAVYQDSLQGLIDQLAADLGRDDIDVVIGRISDFDMKNAKYPHWTIIREAQVAFAESRPHTAWVDTDDLNTGVNKHGKEVKNDLHYTVEGYRIFGERLAEQAIKLIKERAAAEN